MVVQDGAGPNRPAFLFCPFSPISGKLFTLKSLSAFGLLPALQTEDTEIKGAYEKVLDAALKYVPISVVDVCWESIISNTHATILPGQATSFALPIRRENLGVIGDVHGEAIRCEVQKPPHYRLPVVCRRSDWHNTMKEVPHFTESPRRDGEFG